ncbi:MAG: hypothetical protein J6S52_03130 [Prevotella sp.]|nr:hypothetical protein [Prevotella sp.]
MKKKLTLSIACLFSMFAFGQITGEQAPQSNVNGNESVSDIIKMQQEVTKRNQSESHFRSVWSRKGYLNVSYNTTTLSPKDDVPTGVAYNGGKAPEYKSNWGASIQLGRSYALHKRPISNILQFNIDYTYIDLGVNHFKAENDGHNIYDSAAKLTVGDKNDCFYTPWNLEKYDINYGMAVGPSVTVAPFTYTKYAGLHHLKFNVYFHVGYHVGLLYMVSDEKADVNQEGTANYDENRHNKMKDYLKMDLGHGFTTSFGFSLTWKTIGVGYEHRSGSLKYKSLSTDDFGKDSYKFKSSTNRVFVQFRM